MFAAHAATCRAGWPTRLLEGAGATDSNGSTDYDRTNYFDTVPSNQLELALWLHADRMGYLLDVLDQAALSNQQDVVRNERRQSVENRPYGIVEEALNHALFPKGHPYYAAVIGSHADIQAPSWRTCATSSRRYYGPNNASIVIVGDIDKAKTRALVRKYFGSFKRSAPVARPAVATPPITQRAARDGARPRRAAARVHGLADAAGLPAGRRRAGGAGPDPRRRQVEPAVQDAGVRAPDRAGRRTPRRTRTR